MLPTSGLSRMADRALHCLEHKINWLGAPNFRPPCSGLSRRSGHLLYHSEANNGQAGVCFLVNMKWKDNITRVSSGHSIVAELVLRITDIFKLKIVQVYAPTTSHSDEETDNFYNTTDNIMEKETHYTIVMGDFNAKVGQQTNKSERATGCFSLGQ